MTQETPDSIALAVERQLASRGASIRNRAALGALVKIVPVIGEGLHHALTAGTDAVLEEKQRIQLDLLCQLVEKIDAALSEMLEQGRARGAPFEISGSVNVVAHNADSATGIDMGGKSGIIKPGTVVNVSGDNVKNVTGIKS